MHTCQGQISQYLRITYTKQRASYRSRRRSASSHWLVTFVCAALIMNKIFSLYLTCAGMLYVGDMHSRKVWRLCKHVILGKE